MARSVKIHLDGKQGCYTFKYIEPAHGPHAARSAHRLTVTEKKPEDEKVEWTIDAKATGVSKKPSFRIEFRNESPFVDPNDPNYPGQLNYDAKPDPSGHHSITEIVKNKPNWYKYTVIVKDEKGNDIKDDPDIEIQEASRLSDKLKWIAAAFLVALGIGFKFGHWWSDRKRRVAAEQSGSTG